MDNSINQGYIVRSRYLVLLAILLFGSLNALWLLSKKTMGDHECFVSVTAREMLENKNWILPTMNGLPRINKTPLPYWLVAGLGKITGRIDEWTTRFPSAVFTILTALAIFYFVNHWLGFRIAAISSAVWITTVAYIRCSHLGRPDAAVTFFICVCLLSFYSIVISKSRRSQIVYALIFWVSFGLGNLAKGPAPVPFVLIPIFIFIAVNRIWSIIPKVHPLMGTIIFLAILLPWPLLVAHKFNWNFSVWKSEFIDRFTGELDTGNYPIYYYFTIMFKYIAPYIIFLPIALMAPFFKVWSEKRVLMKYLWLWFVTGLIFLTISSGKRQHYILPIMPAMVILVGILLDDMVFSRKAFNSDFVRWIGRLHIFTVAACITGGIVATVIFRPRFLTGVIIFCLIAAAVIFLLIFLWYKGMLKTALVSSFVFISLLFMVYIWFDAVYADGSRPVKEFASQIALKVPANEKLAAYNQVSSTFVNYFGRAVPIIKEINELYQHYQQGDWIFVNSKYTNEMAKHSGFNMVYSRQSQINEPNDASGGLYHKSD